MKQNNASLTKALTWGVAAAVLGGAAPTAADPPAPNPFPGPPPRVFCFRVTDVEGHPTDPDRFKVQFEFLNWTNQPSFGAYIWANEGTRTIEGAPPTIIDAGIDPDGRGGPLGGQHIGPGYYNSPAHQSGRGRGDIPGHLNNWELVFRGPTSVYWGDANPADANPITPIPFRSILTAGSSAAQFALVPGLGNDGLLIPDSAVDGGPPPYGPPTQPAPFPAGGPPNPNGSGNVLDGFWIEVDDFQVGEVLSLNWILADQNGESIGKVGTGGNVVGNAMGFGLFNLTRIPVGGALPPGVFQGNSGFTQGVNFYQNVYYVPDAGASNSPAEFGVEFGAALTAPPLSPTVAEEVPPTLPPTVTVPDIDPETTPPNAEPALCSLTDAADVNQSGFVNVADLQCMLLYAAWAAAGSSGNHPMCFTAPFTVGDLNCDGAITVSDVQVGVVYALGTTFPIEIDGNGNRCHDSCDCSAEICNDNNVCTDDTCSLQGGCVNVPTGCDDGDPCTTDSCHPINGCIFAPVGCGGAPGCTVPAGTPCSDNSLCTSGDMCASGTCVGSAVNCDDGNPCTTDSCNPATGCAHSNVANGTACQTLYQCINGFCVEPQGCVENADCAILNDACRTYKCVSTGTAGVNQCTIGTVTNCNDNNACTDDSCDPILGCQNPVDLTNTCSDNSFCTVGDHCTPAGTCVGTGGLCDDGNPCSVDFCSPDTACYSTPLNGPACNDGSVCTENEVCVMGFCIGQPTNCDDGSVCTADSCHPVQGCQHAPANCNDNNVCTDDSCDPVLGCQHTPNTAPCTDTQGVCTTNDTCSNGACAGTPIDCSDAFACTTDSCHVVNGCQHTAVHSTCNDGVACTADSCSLTLGCRNIPNNNLCGDGQFCTQDLCTATGCQYPNNDGPCDDGNVCTVGDSCVAGLCVPGPDLCTFGNLQGNEFCHVAGSTNDIFECQIRVARKSTDAPVVGAFQVHIVNPDPALIEFESLVAEKCPGGNCSYVTMPQPLDTGHLVVINPASYTSWNQPSGGTVLVYGPPVGVTTAYVDQLGNPVGDAEVLRLRVRVKAEIDSDFPVKLEYSNPVASTTQGSDMVTTVKLGTIVADYPCPLPLQDADGDTYGETCPVCDGAGCLELDDVFCFVSGASGAQVSCPIHIVKRTAGSPPVGGVQFRVELPAGAPLQVDSLQGTVCPVAGFCFDVDFPPPSGQSYTLATGHIVDAVPSSYASWPAANGSSVIIYGGGTSDSVTDAYLNASGVQGDSEVLTLNLTLTSEVLASEPLRLRLRNLAATSPLGSDLEAQALEGRIVVGVPQTMKFCDVFGDIDDVTTCFVRVARQSADTPLLGGVQFAVPIFDPSAVEVVSLTAIRCINGTQCFEVLMPEVLDSGHMVIVQPPDYSMWSPAGGGGVVVFGGTTQSVTNAYLSSSGAMIGNSEMMRLKVKLKAAYSSQAPLEMVYSTVAASSPEGADMDVEVLNGVILASEPQNNELCEVSGVAGQLVSCPIRVARANAGVPELGGLQFDLRVDDPALLEIVSLNAQVCPGGVCQTQVMPYPLDTGHQVVLNPSSYATWKAQGEGSVLIYGGTTNGLTDAVLGAGGAIVGDAEFMSITVRLTQTINSGNPEPIRVVPVGASTFAGTDLTTSLFNSIIVVE